MADSIRAYATAAFRRYAELKMPSHRALLEKAKKKEDLPVLLDILAVEKTLEYFERVNPIVNDALKEVYFLYPTHPFPNKEVIMRIRWFSAERNYSERSIYRWLQQARKVFAENRGLCTGLED